MSPGKTRSGRNVWWINDQDRLDAILRRALDAFHIRLIGIGFSKSVVEGPLDTVKIELDRVRNGDIPTARKAVAEECIVDRGLFSMEIRILPLRATDAAASGMSPHDRGRAPPSVISDVKARLKKRAHSGLVFHDNLYGRTITVLEAESGRYLLRALSPLGIAERRRVGAEMIEYLDKGWWTT